jgi:hypothetical protein
LYVPGAHELHVDDPTAELAVPLLQFVHDDIPIPVLYVPAEQRLQLNSQTSSSAKFMTVFSGAITNTYLPTSGMVHAKDWYHGEAPCTLLVSLKHLVIPAEFHAVPVANAVFDTQISNPTIRSAQQSDLDQNFPPQIPRCTLKSTIHHSFTAVVSA